MYELIYYTIPGLVVTVALFFWGFSEFNEVQIIAFFSASPIVGYASHQIFRILFEVTGRKGHWREGRKVIDRISAEFSTRRKTLDRQAAFLIWEVSIYDKDVSSHFLEHDARMWRFIISHWALSFTFGFLFIIFVILACCSQQTTWIQTFMLVLFPVLSILFYAAGNQVFQLLNIQEIGYFERNKKDFQKTANALGWGKVTVSRSKHR